MGWPINWPPGGVVSILICLIEVGYQELFLVAAAPFFLQSAGCSRRREIISERAWRGAWALSLRAVSADFSFLLSSLSPFPL